jgi:NADPH-dependent ferric siderophore reductase
MLDDLNAARDVAEPKRELPRTQLRTFLSEVATVTDITPTLRQITFRGGLDDFEPLDGDQFLYVLLPPKGRTELTFGADFAWEAYEQMPEAERPTGAYYTVRHWRADVGELDMWFVLHGDAGEASAWASRAEPGQPVGLWGPRRVFYPPATTGSYLLVVDETGFGAVAAVLDQLLAADPDVDVRLIAESDGLAGRVEFPAGPNVTTTWVDRAGAAPGTTTGLLDAVQRLEISTDTYAFGAAESRRITAIRNHLRDHVGLAAEQVSMTGYWRAS